MKTPDEIKKGLECCAQSEPCVDCVYDRRDFPMCIRRMLKDALAYIQQLEAAHRTEYCEDADYDCKRLGDARKRIQQLENHICELTENVAQLETREWELFDRLSSAWCWKGCYSKQDDGTVYSKASCQYLSFDQAIDEFAIALTNAYEVE